MRFAGFFKPVVLTFLLCVLAFPAQAGEPVLVNGASGEYWGLSEKAVAAKAPGKAAGKKKMAGMVLLDYAATVKNVPVMTGYTLKNDECWKITIQLAATDAATSAIVRALYEEAVAEITTILGEPVEPDDPERPTRMISWKTDTTSCLLFAELNNPDKADLSISFESPALSEKIWGKRK